MCVYQLMTRAAPFSSPFQFQQVTSVILIWSITDIAMHVQIWVRFHSRVYWYLWCAVEIQVKLQAVRYLRTQ